MRIVLAAALLASGTSAAAAFCYQPTAPYCATRFGSFSDDFEFQRCRREMETYREEVEQMIACLKRYYNEAVESFNRRARS